MTLIERLRVMAARWEEWAGILGTEAAAAVRECAADLRGELRPRPAKRQPPKA